MVCSAMYLYSHSILTEGAVGGSSDKKSNVLLYTMWCKCAFRAVGETYDVISVNVCVYV